MDTPELEELVRRAFERFGRGRGWTYKVAKATQGGITESTVRRLGEALDGKRDWPEVADRTHDALKRLADDTGPSSAPTTVEWQIAHLEAGAAQLRAQASVLEAEAAKRRADYLKSLVSQDGKPPGSGPQKPEREAAERAVHETIRGRKHRTEEAAG